MRTIRVIFFLAVVLGVAVVPQAALAQATPSTPTEPQATPTPLTIFTNYPSQVIGIGETVNLGLKVRTGTSGVVTLSVEDAPEGWTAYFRGGGRIVGSVYADGERDASVDLRVEPPADVPAGEYTITVVAEREGETARLPLTLTVEEKLPPKLSLTTDLPTLLGKPGTSFRWDVTLKNEGDVDLTASLTAEAPEGFDVSFTLSGKEVTNVPLEANKSKRISVQARSLKSLPAGDYPLLVRAEGDDAQAELPLVAQVAGTPDVTLTTPDGRLSGDATVGKATPFKLIVANRGAAPAKAIALSSSAPSGWTITFDPEQIDELPPGQQVDVTANIQPADKALAGDYVVSISAKPEGASNEKVELRITVKTSNLWGIVGIILIAVAVGVVAIAVSRYGRR